MCLLSYLVKTLQSSNLQYVSIHLFAVEQLKLHQMLKNYLWTAPVVRAAVEKKYFHRQHLAQEFWYRSDCSSLFGDEGFVDSVDANDLWTKESE